MEADDWSRQEVDVASGVDCGALFSLMEDLLTFILEGNAQQMHIIIMRAK